MFLIYVSGFLALILALALISVNFLFEGRTKFRLYKILIFADLAIILLMIGGFTIRNLLPNAAVGFLGSVATVFLWTQLICGIMVVLAVIVRAIYRKFHKPTEFSPERRRMLKWSLLYPVMSLAISLYGNRIERLSVAENFYSIPIKNLPPELDGFKIAQISDVHLGAYYSLDKLRELLQKVADAKPDLLAITGDIFDDVELNGAAIRIVDEFCDKFKFGIYYCHGNHEHFRGIQQIERALSTTKIHWLVNRSENVTSKLYVLGVDYPRNAPVMQSGGNGNSDEQFYKNMRDFVEKALTGVPYDSVCVLLAHHPEFIDTAAEKNIPLTLTGHTHGGQFGIFGMSLLPVFKYTRGMVKHDDSYGYVHVGNGSWFPLRIGCPPEIAYFTLTKK